MQIFHIPTTVLLTTFLVFSAELREFCNFHDSIPYDSFFSRFKTEFEKAFIPLNPRNQANILTNGLEYSTEGIPLCPLTKEEFKAEGPCKGKNRSLRFKFTCPKSFRDKRGKCYHTCEKPCTDKKSGRMTYVYPDKDFRLYPGVQRNSLEWDEAYPIRASVERCISSFKFNPFVERPCTVSTSAMRADLYLTAICKLINVMLAYALGNPKYIRNINKLLKIAA